MQIVYLNDIELLYVVRYLELCPLDYGVLLFIVGKAGHFLIVAVTLLKLVTEFSKVPLGPIVVITSL